MRPFLYRGAGWSWRPITSKVDVVHSTKQPLVAVGHRNPTAVFKSEIFLLPIACSHYCAAGAIAKECKRVSVPEVLFKQLLKRIDRTASDPLFWATCGRRAVFEVENRGSRGSDRAQILSAVCLSDAKK